MDVKGRMTLPELRKRLTDLGKPATGTKAELENAMEWAMREQRLMTMSWDTTTESWVPSPGKA